MIAPDLNNFHEEIDDANLLKMYNISTKKEIEKNTDIDETNDEFEFDLQQENFTKDCVRKENEHIYAEADIPESTEKEQSINSSKSEENLNYVHESARKALESVIQKYSNADDSPEHNVDNLENTGDALFHGKGDKIKDESSFIMMGATLGKTVIVDTIEEGDEDEIDGEDGNIERDHIVNSETRESTSSEKLIDEWDNLPSDGGIDSGGVSSINNQNSFTDADLLSYTYFDSISYIKSLDLSCYQDSIITGFNKDGKDNNEKRGSKSFLSTFLGKGNTDLNFEGSKEQLELPFLIAQIDYDANNEHIFRLLSVIYMKLCAFGGIKAEKPEMIGDHWERIGFQGKNPSTDLNRAMKMLTLLFTLHLIETESEFSKKLYNLSITTEIFKSQTVGNVKSSSPTIDKSWPFMCVSVMFTRESIRALRSGSLNPVCNEKKDILSVVNTFHHACFGEFFRYI